MRNPISSVGVIMMLLTTLSAAEPNVEVAGKWWPPLTNVVTHIGWRDHFHRFNICYEGTIIARPPQKPPQPGDQSNPLAGVQLSFAPSIDGTLPSPPTTLAAAVDSIGRHVGDQGWTDDPAPVLWTRWKPAGPLAGLEMRAIAFAHLAGDGEPQTGLEPMYCWVRLQVTARDPSARADTCGFLIQLNAPHIKFDMIESQNFRVAGEESRYPRNLRAQRGDDGSTNLVEDDGKIRLAILAGAGEVRFTTPDTGAGQRDYHVFVSMPAAAGSHVDLLVPMLRQEPAVFDEERALGRDRALAGANACWAPRPDAASIHTPEPLINAAIARSIQLARINSITIPSTGQKTLLSGSMVYSMLWITPTSMTSHMLLDPLGWHDEVEKYLEIHRQEQGSVKAPGPAYPMHPGYFGVPAAVDSGNQWLTDHGAVMYTASRHAMLTNDKAFIEKWTQPLIKGYQFIRDSRRLPREAPQVNGVMPSASASDISRPIQSFWSDAWNYKGLAETARLFKRINHPLADELQREADDYHAAIVAAFRAKAARMPKWKDGAGNDRTLVPMSLTADDSDGYSAQHPFYLDTGPMFGVWSGVLPASDPLMIDSVAFFRDGPHTHGRMRDERFDWKNAAMLVHEISNAEPCYSWNVYHTHQLGDRDRYLEALYSLFVGAMSTQTYVGCETRGGITENVFSNTLAVDLARLAVIDDLVEPGALHLLRLAPLAWCSRAEQTRFERMATEFGPVSLRWQLTDGGKTLDVVYEPHFHHPPKSVVLHVPPTPGVESVRVNRNARRVQPGGRIEL